MLLGVVWVDLTVCLGRQVGREPTEERKEKLRKLEAMAREYENLEMQADALKVKEVCTRVYSCAQVCLSVLKRELKVLLNCVRSYCSGYSSG